MRALVAPDDFKGTFTAPQVAAAIAAGLRGAGVEADELPIADGGDGTIDALLVSLGGSVQTARVPDPLGRPVRARWAMLADGETAVSLRWLKRAACGASPPRSAIPGRLRRGGPGS